LNAGESITCAGWKIRAITLKQKHCAQHIAKLLFKVCE
jgi:hypothetical protein